MKDEGHITNILLDLIEILGHKIDKLILREDMYIDLLEDRLGVTRQWEIPYIIAEPRRYGGSYLGYPIIVDPNLKVPFELTYRTKGTQHGQS